MKFVKFNVFALALFVITLYRVPAAQADIITLVDWGAYSQSPFSVDSGLNVWQAEAYNGTLYLGGSYQGQAAVQRITFGEGGASTAPVQVLNSLANQAQPGALNGGEVRDIKTYNGQVYYYGQSRSPSSVSGSFEATAWNASTGNPQALGFGYSGGGYSSVLSASEVGIATGGSGGTGTPVYSLNGESSNIALSGAATAISADGTLILVGTDYYRSSGPVGSLEYTLAGGFDSLQSPGGNLLIGSFGRWVFNDPLLGEIGLFETINTETFAMGYGAWNLTDGSFLKYFGDGELADAKVYGDELVFAMNSTSGAFLSTLSSDNRLYLSDLFGTEMSNLSFTRGALYEGSLGFVALGSDGNGGNIGFGASYEFSTTAVPEPSSLLLMGSAGLLAAAFRRRLGLVK